MSRPARGARTGAFLAATALFLLSIPGVRIARASDLAPSARELIGGAAPPAGPLAPASSCSLGAAVQRRAANQQALMAALQSRMRAEGGGDWRPLNGRGVGYAVRPSPAVEMQRIQAEAAAQRSK